MELTKVPLRFHITTLICCLITIGVLNFSTFGISYDEPAMRLHGIATVKEIRNTLFGQSPILALNDPRFSAFKKPELDNPDAKAHPVTLEMLLVGSEYFLGITENKALVWKVRHLITFLVNAIALVFFFLMITRRFESYFAGYLGVIVLLTSPRIFGDMFYNNKDLFFLTTYFVATFFSFRFIVKPTLMLGCLAGLFVGLSASIRLVGFTIVFAVFLTFLFGRINSKMQGLNISALLSYFATSVVSLILFLPYLWTNTFTKLLALPTNALSFNWIGKTLFAGKTAWSNDLPWNYLPLWIFATTPPLISFLGVAGCIFAAFVLAKQRFSANLSSKFGEKNLLDFFMLQLLLIPILSAGIFNVTIYNGWRHFYFVYPFIVYFSLFSIFSLCRNFKVIRSFFIFAVALSVAFSTSWLIRFSPLSGLYFSSLAGKNISQNWEVDYWAISNREILERISTLDPGSISLYDWNNSPLYDSEVFLSDEVKMRVSFLRLSDNPALSDYIIDRSNSCKKSGDYCVFRGDIVTQEIIRRYVGAAHVYSVYRVKKSPT